MLAPYRDERIDLVVGMESRGFIFSAPMAYQLGAGLVPVRKLGKLPAETLTVEYALEYGSNTLEIHRDAIRPGQRVLIVDDLLATGGTVGGTIELVERLQGEVVGLAFLVELDFLKGRDRLGGRGSRASSGTDPRSMATPSPPMTDDVRPASPRPDSPSAPRERRDPGAAPTPAPIWPGGASSASSRRHRPHARPRSSARPTALQRTSAEAASAILGGSAASGGLAGLLGDQLAADASTASTDQASPAPGAAGRLPDAPSAGTATRLYLVDQRRLPDELVEVRLRDRSRRRLVDRRDGHPRRPGDRARRRRVGLALTAARMRRSPVPSSGGRRSWGAATPSSTPGRRPPTSAGRSTACLERLDALGDLTRTATIADAMREEADAIISEATDDHGRLADVRPRRAARDAGPAAPAPHPLQHRAPRRRPVRDRAGRRSRPPSTPAARCTSTSSRRGRTSRARALTAWELAQAGVPHTVITDSAAGWVLSSRTSRRRARGRRARRGQRRRGEQDRHLPAGGPRRAATACRSSSAPRCRAWTPRRPTARRSRSSSAPARRSSTIRGG